MFISGKQMLTNEDKQLSLGPRILGQCYDPSKTTLESPWNLVHQNSGRKSHLICPYLSIDFLEPLVACG